MKTSAKRGPKVDYVAVFDDVFPQKPKVTMKHDSYSNKCWCCPTIEIVTDPMTGLPMAEIVIHNSLEEAN